MRNKSSIPWMTWDYRKGDNCPIPDAKAGRYEIKTESGHVDAPKCDAAKAQWGWHRGAGAEAVNIIAYRRTL